VRACVRACVICVGGPAHLEDGAEHHVLQALEAARLCQLVVRLEGLQEVRVRRLVVAWCGVGTVS